MQIQFDVNEDFDDGDGDEIKPLIRQGSLPAGGVDDVIILVGSTPPLTGKL